MRCDENGSYNVCICDWGVCWSGLQGTSRASLGALPSWRGWSHLGNPLSGCTLSTDPVVGTVLAGPTKRHQESMISPQCAQHTSLRYSIAEGMGATWPSSMDTHMCMEV